MLVCPACALSFIKSDLQYDSAFCKMSLAALGHREVLWLHRLPQHAACFPSHCFAEDDLNGLCRDVRGERGVQESGIFWFQLLMFSI